MINRKITSVIILTWIFLFLPVGLVSARTVENTVGSSSGTNVKLPTRNLVNKMTNWKNRANNEITNRIGTLNGLIERIQNMKRLSQSNKSSLISQVQAEILIMQNLLQKIQADTDIVVLKTDMESITKSFRVYMLFIPKIHILSAAERIDDISADMIIVSNKLQTRITDLTMLNEVKTKIANAQVHAQKARDLVLPLQPDNGDKAVMDSNKEILKQARNEIKAGNEDLKAARENLHKIIQQLKKLNKTTPTP